METSKTSSTRVAYGGEHLFKIVGHSLITGDNAFVTSETFRVGGHDWTVRYYPNGDTRVVDGQFSTVCLCLMSDCEGENTAGVSFCLQDPAMPATGEKNKCSFNIVFSPSSTAKQKTWCYIRFVSKADLAASGCLKDDCLVIKCTVDVSKFINDARENEIVVPPSSFSQDLHSMLGSGKKEDLTFKVGGLRIFKAHSCLLSARSPVFHAKLCDSVMESTISIEDMDAEVFEVLLHYMYHDCLPGFMEENTEEATSMARRLLVVADGYGVERLKLMCESNLSKVVDVSTVCSVLVFAKQHKCQQLKDFCLKYIATDRERLEVIRGTEGFKQLKEDYPLVDGDILDQVIGRLPHKKKELLVD